MWFSDPYLGSYPYFIYSTSHLKAQFLFVSNANQFLKTKLNKQTKDGDDGFLFIFVCGSSDGSGMFDPQLPKNFNAECSDDREKISALPECKNTKSTDLKENMGILNAHRKLH